MTRNNLSQLGLILLLGTLIPTPVLADYENQWDCLISELQDVETDSAAKVMKRYCIKTYPFVEIDQDLPKNNCDKSAWDKGCRYSDEVPTTSYIYPSKKAPSFWEPGNSLECFKKYGKKARSQVAAQIIRNTCNSWYPR